MEKVDKKINDFLNDLLSKVGKPDFDMVQVIEEYLLKACSEEEKQQYYKYKNILTHLRQELDKIPEIKLLDTIIKESKEGGLNRNLDSDEEVSKKNLMINIERAQLIINLSQRIDRKEANLSTIAPNLDKYVISNFYRTMCELSIKLFTNILSGIIVYQLNILKQKELPTEKEAEDIIDMEKEKSRIENNMLGLDDFKTILARFDKRLNLNIGLHSVIDEVFLFREGKGFSLRNKVAHERLYFNEMDIDLFVKEIKKISKFNNAFIHVFLWKNLAQFMQPKDLNPSRKMFSI